MCKGPFVELHRTFHTVHQQTSVRFSNHGIDDVVNVDETVLVCVRHIGVRAFVPSRFLSAAKKTTDGGGTTGTTKGEKIDKVVERLRMARLVAPLRAQRRMRFE